MLSGSRKTRTFFLRTYKILMKKKNETGFTLVELLVTVSIISIIFAVGGYSIITYRPYGQLKSGARDVFSTMMQAKAQAIQQGSCVSVQFRPATNDYMMFLDDGVGGGTECNGTQDGGETLFLPPIPLPDRVSYDPTVDVDGVSFPNNNSLIFTNRGITNGIGGAGTVTLRALDSNGNTVRQRSIVVSMAGRIVINTL